MHSPFEIEIKKALLNSANLNIAIDTLIKKWQSYGYDKNSTESFFIFLYLSGYHLTLAAQLEFLILNKQSIPWRILLAIATNVDTNILNQSVDFKTIIDQLDKDNLDQIAKYSIYDNIHTSFHELRHEFITREIRERINTKKALLKNLEVARNEHLVDEEKKIIDSLLNTFSEDEEILRLHHEFQIKYADKIFEKKASHKPFIFKKPVKEKIKGSDYQKEMLNLVKSNPDNSYIVATSLFISGCYDDALNILDSKNDLSQEEDWLKIEILTRADLNLLAVDFAKTLEEKYGSEPTKMMAALYYQAINLKILGEYNEAVKIMKTILKYDAEFKSAYVLLSQWEKA